MRACLCTDACRHALITLATLAFSESCFDLKAGVDCVALVFASSSSSRLDASGR